MAPPKAQKGEKKRTVRVAGWYKSDDEDVHFRRRQRKPKATRLRKNIVPGQVLILLSGRFRGKRVVFLRQLQSGLLLVTGPHKVNGVPLKRVNQAYVIPTSTKVDLSGVNAANVDDAYFARTKVAQRKNEQGFWAKNGELTEEQRKAENERMKKKRETQAGVDKALLANVKKVELLKQYLSSRFSLTRNLRPHELVF